MQDTPTFITGDMDIAGETGIADKMQPVAATVPSSEIPAATIQTTPDASPEPLAAAAAALTATPASQHIFGLDVLDFYDLRSAQAIIDLGVKWVRIDFNRAYIEPTSRAYNWSDYDSFMLKMQKAGVQVLAQVTLRLHGSAGVIGQPSITTPHGSSLTW